MLDIVFDVVDIFLNIIIDDTVDKATNKKAKKNLRYILFSVFCVALIIAFAVMIVYTFRTGYPVISLLFIVLSVAVAVCWCRLSYLKNRKKN